MGSRPAQARPRWPSTRCSAPCSSAPLGREPLAILLGSAYAVTDELHQIFVSGRHGSPVDWLIDTLGVVAGVLLFARWAASRSMKAVAVDLDALGDTRPLWQRLPRRRGPPLRVDRAARPGRAPRRPRRGRRRARPLGGGRVGDWRGALERFAEDRAPVYLRPSAEANAALRALAAAQASASASSRTRPSRSPASRSRTSGAARRVELLETGAGAQRERLVGRPRRVRSSRSRDPGRPGYDQRSMQPERSHLDDRQLDAILERLDRLCDEVHALNRRLDSATSSSASSHELRQPERVAPGARLRGARLAGPAGPPPPLRLGARPPQARRRASRGSRR